MNDTIEIDICKERLNAFRLSDGMSQTFENSQAGFRKLRGCLDRTSTARAVYEATGAFHGAFERACAEHLPLCKVNPLQARRFAQTHGTRARTGAVDARMLALMGSAFELDKPMRKDEHELKELRIARTALVKERARLQNRLKTQTLAVLRRPAKSVIAQLIYREHNEHLVTTV